MAETDQHDRLLSPVRPASKNIPRKPIKPPTITPRRFKKFFNPISTSKIQRNVRTSRKALQEITNPPGKEKHSPVILGLPTHDDDQENASALLNEPRGRKRKLSFASVESPMLSSPLRPEPFFLPSSQDNDRGSEPTRGCSAQSIGLQQEEPDQERGSDNESEDEDEVAPLRVRRPAIRYFNTISKSSSILCSRLSGRGRQKEPRNSKIWQSETATFYSNATDAYFYNSQVFAHPALPFCSASCNTNSLVAIGDEEGGIRLLDSAPNIPDGFSKAYLSFKPHDNAIMDIDFSEDDALLATGSGDQTCRIIDMLSQTTLHTLSGHSSSIRRVQFQPGSKNSIVASCSRDGNVNIWDLRTRSFDRPTQQICRLSNTGVEEPPMGFNMPAVSLRDSIRAAHSHRDHSRKATLPKTRSNHRREDPSVTSVVFLGAGREHLLATSSEADATVKLWDMRTTYDTRRARPLPLSTTRQPASHETHRRFGLTSMALSGDGARLYTLCRDHTIYVYSSSHLILGRAPELTTTSTRPRRAGGPERDGLGPLYGFRHQQLQASTFYVKLSIRRQKDDKTELLATGSGNDCAVLFPTNERYLGCEPLLHSSVARGRPSLPRLNSQSRITSSSDHEIPIYQHGTALIRGHRKEVTSLTWTSGGELVTVSDDFHIRCWREGDQARDLRTGGEGEGRRWMCGWADMDSSYDNEE